MDLASIAAMQASSAAALEEAKEATAAAEKSLQALCRKMSFECTVTMPQGVRPGKQIVVDVQDKK